MELESRVSRSAGLKTVMLAVDVGPVTFRHVPLWEGSRLLGISETLSLDEDQMLPYNIIVSCRAMINSDML